MKTAWHLLLRTAVPLTLVALFMGCKNDDNKPTPPTDTTPPAAVSDLATGTVTSSSIALTWTAPGDDNATGTAKTYDVRYSTANITASNFASATPVTGEPVPVVAGTSQGMTVAGLFSNTQYYFAMKTSDEAANTSAISNVVHATTSISTDTTPPAAITNLTTGIVTASSIVLHWSAPGDDGATGTATQYDVRYSTSAITAENFDAATQATGEPAPAVAGTAQQMTVAGLTANTEYFFAIKTSDEAPNVSGISNVVSATTSNAADTTPPAAITTLVGSALSATEVQLSWTAPGDDGATGTAASYDVRYSTAAITAGNFGSATQATGEPAPAAAGTSQNMTIASLNADTNYFFAVKTTDEASNVSAISNIAQVHTPAAVTGPPELTVPEFPDTVCISSQDQYAQMAKAMAQGQLSLVNIYGAMLNAWIAPMRTANWQQNGNCWNWDYSAAGCAEHYQACLTGNTYSYSLTVNGNCGGTSYSSWVAFSADVNYTARTGTFKLFNENATTIAAAWTWTWAADNNSGNYTFYDGDPATAAVLATIDWVRSADLNVYDVTFIQPQSEKWVTHVVKNPCSGLLQGYQWSSTSNDWWKETEISWTGGDGGYWDTFDDTGTQIEHHVW